MRWDRTEFFFMRWNETKDESSRPQESQEEKLRQELSSSNMILQKWYELKMMKLKLEMMRLEAQKLDCQERLAERDVSFQSLTSNESPAPIYWWDKIDIFHRYIAFKTLKLAFKLKN